MKNENRRGKNEGDDASTRHLPLHSTTKIGNVFRFLSSLNVFLSFLYKNTLAIL